jgi:hypothetical protein
MTSLKELKDRMDHFGYWDGPAYGERPSEHDIIRDAQKVIEVLIQNRDEQCGNRTLGQILESHGIHMQPKPKCEHKNFDGSYCVDCKEKAW